MRLFNSQILILLFALLPLTAISSEQTLFWYDEARKINLWQHGYSAQHQSFIYAESPSPKAVKQVLTGRIIIVFLNQKNDEELQSFMMEHNLTLINKLAVGMSTYLFKTMGENNDSLQIANHIYQQQKVKAAYPDWMYLIRIND